MTKSRAFKLPGKKKLQPADHEIEFIVPTKAVLKANGGMPDFDLAHIVPGKFFATPGLYGGLAVAVEFVLGKCELKVPEPIVKPRAKLPAVAEMPKVTITFAEPLGA